MAPEYIGGIGAAAEEAAALEGPQIKLGEPWSQLGGLPLPKNGENPPMW